MGKNKAASQAAVNPDLPDALASAVVRAEAGCFPTFTEEEQARCPTLHSLLAPQLVNDPNHKGKGDPKKVLREPLLMISWDRAGGAWKWAIGDKLMNLAWDGPLPSLVGIAESVEIALAEGRYRVKKKKVS